MGKVTSVSLSPLTTATVSSDISHDWEGGRRPFLGGHGSVGVAGGGGRYTRHRQWTMGPRKRGERAPLAGRSGGLSGRCDERRRWRIARPRRESGAAGKMRSSVGVAMMAVEGEGRCPDAPLFRLIRKKRGSAGGERESGVRPSVSLVQRPPTN